MRCRRRGDDPGPVQPCLGQRGQLPSVLMNDQRHSSQAHVPVGVQQDFTRRRVISCSPTASASVSDWSANCLRTTVAAFCSLEPTAATFRGRIASRHDPRHLRAAGLHRPAGSTGAATVGASDALPRGVRAAQCMAGPDHPGGAGQKKASDCASDPGGATPGDELGAAAEAGVQSRP